MAEAARPLEPAPPEPYVPASERPTELTLRGLAVGALLGIAFAASSVYLGLKVGLTVSASIPIAVLSITLFRAFGRASILENNIVQTTGSAGESIAAGVAFTLPSLLLMGFELDLWRTTAVALLGGLLGVLLMIPLRRGLIVREHATLPYPEGTACAEVLIVGDRGGAAARTVFSGFGLGFVFNLLGQIARFWGEVASWSFDRFYRGGSLSFETNPALLGVGYIIGTRIALVMLGGGLLSFWVLVPAVKLFAPDLTSPLVAAGKVAVRDMTPGQIRSAYLLYIGAGAVAAGGLLSLLRALPSLWAAFRGAAASFSFAGDSTGARTERDLPLSLVLGGALALLLAIPLAPRLGLGFPSAFLVLLFGFFFVTVSSRITGQIGSSSNPISGMTVATLLATCLLFAAIGWTGVPYKEMALATAALVCVSASNGGTTSQDLKTGFLVGATPRAQQIAIAVGVITSALVIGATLLYLNAAATTYVPRSHPALVANEETVRAVDAAHPGRLAFAPERLAWRGASWRVLYVRQPTDGVPVGKYLVGDDDRIAWLVDPGVCGIEPEQRGPDGRVEKVVSKFDAPKAQLFRLIIDGVLDRNLPWELVLIGVSLALMMELCGVPSLPFAVGAYLPLSTSTSIALGGFVRHLADRRARRSAASAEHSPGVLFASGLIAGGAIAGLLYAVLAGVEATGAGPDGVPRPEPLLRHLGLVLSERILGADASSALVANPWWTMMPFVALACVLLIVAGRRGAEASR
ncbi:MAG TPA: oligopeptide transporter, OPT family [Myxococcota bacterium]|nr:oligopeptide transporter, OPT family [Myxococcota bacterium]